MLHQFSMTARSHRIADPEAANRQGGHLRLSCRSWHVELIDGVVDGLENGDLIPWLKSRDRGHRLGDGGSAHGVSAPFASAIYFVHWPRLCTTDDHPDQPRAHPTCAPNKNDNTRRRTVSKRHRSYAASGGVVGAQSPSMGKTSLRAGGGSRHMAGRQAAAMSSGLTTCSRSAQEEAREDGVGGFSDEPMYVLKDDSSHASGCDGATSQKCTRHQH